jgi:diaminopimelate decarboxylase
VTGFHRPDNALVCDGVALTDLAAAEGTPLYVYSAATIVSRYRAIDEAFRSHPHAVHYALKANSTLAIARLLLAASRREFGRRDAALRAGFIPRDRFTASARPRGLAGHRPRRQVDNAESEASWSASTAWPGGSARAPCVNPDHCAIAHPTRIKANKFSIALDAARGSAGVQPGEGLEIIEHTHVGSQTDLDPRRAARRSSLPAQGRQDRVDHLIWAAASVSYDGSPLPMPTRGGAAAGGQGLGLAIVMTSPTSSRPRARCRGST